MTGSELQPRDFGDREDRDPAEVEAAVGVRVRQRRELLGFSQAFVAQRMVDQGFPWHQTTVAKVEAGERPMRLVEALFLAQMLQFGTLDELVTGRQDWARERVSQLRSARVELQMAKHYIEQRGGQVDHELDELLEGFAGGEPREEA